jgi:hypothetical protein
MLRELGGEVGKKMQISGAALIARVAPIVAVGPSLGNKPNSGRGAARSQFQLSLDHEHHMPAASTGTWSK